ncbi:MAG: hypothetical protein CMJ78_05040 [Planctomycetaceae bacterium]|nr:hypothetical protein [Planctomycetaceae bacterium]
MWELSDVLTLYWCDTELGTITNLSGDQPWMFGDFEPHAAAQKFRLFFDACVNEDDSSDDIEALFDPELLADENWHVRKQDLSRLDISLPAIHRADSNISWRWRSDNTPHSTPHPLTLVI